MEGSKKINFYTNLIYFVVVAGFVVIRICSNFGLFSFLGDYGGYVLSIITQLGLLLFLPLLLFKIFSKSSVKETFKFCSFKKISYKSVLVAIVLGVIVFFLNVYVSSFFNSIIQFFGYKPSTSSSALPSTWWVLLLNLLCTAVLPAICEETLHRGLLLKGNSNLGMKKSILISGFLFGLLHLNIEQFFYASIIGLFLGYLCWCTSSIYPCIIIHFMNNGISVFLSFARDKGWAIGNIFVAISEFLTKNPVLGFVMFMLVLCLLFIFALELTKFLIKDAFTYSFAEKHKELASKFIRQSYFNDIENIKNNQYSSNQTPDGKEIIYVNADDLAEFVGKNLESVSLFQKTDKSLENKSKIFLWASFALSAIITIMTFIWGLL